MSAESVEGSTNDQLKIWLQKSIQQDRDLMLKNNVL